MALTPHTLSAGKRTTRGSRRLGRGNASQKGTTAGKGTKGQKARTGGRGGLKMKGLKKGLLKVPKIRGFKSPHPRPAMVTLAMLERAGVVGQRITPVWLVKRGLVSSIDHGVKIVGTGALTKALTIEECLVSRGAVAVIEKAGGKVTF